MHLLWEPHADRVMAQLEADGSLETVLAALRRTLGRLERDPCDPRLRTRQFSTEGYGRIRCTRALIGNWSVFWESGPAPDEITIVHIAAVSI